MANCEGSLFVEVNSEWKHCFCWIRDGQFQAFDKKKTISTSNKGRQALLQISLSSCEASGINPSPDYFALNAQKTNSHLLPVVPLFFEITSDLFDETYTFVCGSAGERERWISAVSSVNKTSRPFSKRATMLFRKDSSDSSKGNRQETYREKRSSSLRRLESVSMDKKEYKLSQKDAEKHESRFCSLKLDTLFRLLKVFSAYPFVIVISTLNVSNFHPIFRSITFIRLMNLMIYAIPFVFVDVLLSKTNSLNIQILYIGMYISVYLIPVGYVVAQKLNVSSSTSKIEDGTFCFRPASSVRPSFANLVTIQGFLMEFMQHVLFCCPLGIFAKEKASTVEDLPPFLPYLVYFVGAILAVFLCGLIIVLNTVLRGKTHYRFANNIPLMWFFLYSTGGNGFISCVTVLFMALWCDYDVDGPPVLVQDSNIVCWETLHTRMAVAALICLAVFLIQFTLLPSGTYKETIRNKLDIIFVPVYLQAHYLLKAIFCGVYVNFYTDDWTRITILTIINILILLLNSKMKPCSVQSVNIYRNAYFMCAVLAGFQSLNYIANRDVNNFSEKDVSSQRSYFISTLFTNMALVCLGMCVFHIYSIRSTKYQIARVFLDLEWQVSKGGTVDPRIMEPLISLTLKEDDEESLAIAKTYIEQLVWLLSYPNMRVQFQSAWALANLAIVDEDSRLKIHKANGTKSLFEWYMDMDFVVQLETLAALVNLTLSYEVAQDMVERYKCIPFFLSHVSGTKLKHAQFASIAIGNLARKEEFREQIRLEGGLPILVGCILSSDYSKRRYGALALANMAMSSSVEIVQVFESKGLLDKIIKMAVRNEIETQREVTALLRNISCHPALHVLLLERRVIDAIDAAQSSVYPEVVEWANEMLELMDKHLMRASKKTNSALTNGVLTEMTPLEGSVTWTTWGSKLETIFLPVFSTVPTPEGLQILAHVNEPVEVYLSNSISALSKSRWKGTMTYIISEQPCHGTLNTTSTTGDFILYTPHEGYVGSDFFMFKVCVGSIKSSSANVSIAISEKHTKQNSSGEAEAGGSAGKISSSSSSRGENRNETLKRRQTSARKSPASTRSPLPPESLEASLSPPSPSPLSSPHKTPDDSSVRSQSHDLDMTKSTYSQVQRQSNVFKSHHTGRVDPADLL